MVVIQPYIWPIAEKGENILIILNLFEGYAVKNAVLVNRVLKNLLAVIFKPFYSF